MLDVEYPEGRAGLGRVGPEVKYRALRLAKVGEVDIDRHHAAEHRPVGIGSRRLNRTVEILCPEQGMRLHVSGVEPSDDIVGEIHERVHRVQGPGPACGIGLYLVIVEFINQSARTLYNVIGVTLIKLRRIAVWRLITL